MVIGLLVATGFTPMPSAWAQSAATQQQPVPPDPIVAVAVIDSVAISRAAFDHWLIAAYHRNGLSGTPRCPPPPAGSDTEKRLRSETMAFLIRGQWLEAEAKRRSIKVTTSEVRRAFVKHRKRAFANSREYQRFLREGCGLPRQT